MNKRKTIIAVFYLLVLGIVLFAVFTPRWETYTNKEAGFQISYPKGFLSKGNTLIFDEHEPHLFIEDPNTDVNYLGIRAYKGKLSDNKDFAEPLPKVIPANGKNGELTVIKQVLNGIPGVEIYGVVTEGFAYADTFCTEKGEYVYCLDLHPSMEGRTGKSFEFEEKVDAEVYKKIKDSFKLI